MSLKRRLVGSTRNSNGRVKRSRPDAVVLTADSERQYCADRSVRAPSRQMFFDAGVNTMGFASEFKAFAMKGNVVDLAVGVIIGAAFGKIVDSIVSDLIMPIVGKIFGGLDFSNYFIPLAAQTATNLADAKKAGAVFAYGNFITVALNFAILAFIIFLMIRQINRMRGDTPAAPPPPPEDVVLLREIRDALRK
jgi:large conductance mechanosensitive channel